MEKIQELKGQINYKKRSTKRTEEEIHDLEILLEFYKDMLKKKHNNPSSVKFGKS